MVFQTSLLGELTSTLSAHVLDLQMHRLVVGLQLCNLREGLATLAALFVLDLQVYGLYVLLQVERISEGCPALCTYVFFDIGMNALYMVLQVSKPEICYLTLSRSRGPWNRLKWNG